MTGAFWEQPGYSERVEGTAEGQVPGVGPAPVEQGASPAPSSSTGISAVSLTVLPGIAGGAPSGSASVSGSTLDMTLTLVPGVTGTDGASVLSGVGAPAAATGKNGDTYINLTNGEVYQKASGAWNDTGYSLQGKSSGSAGSSFLTGTGVPSASSGNNGDSYVDLTTGNVYQKASGAWSPTGYTLKGAAGTNGTNGTNGSPGTNGSNGSNGASFLSGSGAPASATGNNGDTYIDLVTGNVYQKASGAWAPTGNSLKGAAGTNGTNGTNGGPGTNGTNGASFLSGSGAPAAGTGNNGDTYVNLANGEVFQKASGTWADTGASLKGATGAAATVQIGAVTALAQGANPTVTNSGSSAAAILNFGIPAGASGVTATPNLPYIDVKAKYGAFFDGTSHPLSASMTLAQAQAAYPAAGVTSSNLSTMEADTAALIQAESDARNGSGGILFQPDNSTAMLSQQINFQNAGKVWWWGGRYSVVNTYKVPAGTPAVQIQYASASPANNGVGGFCVPLQDLQFVGQNGVVFNPGGQGGTAWTGYRTNAIALLIGNSQNFIISRCQFNGYDTTLTWGPQNDWNCLFDYCSFTGNNHGITWPAASSGVSNSMEKMVFRGGICANNNVGVYWDARIGSSGAEAGSVFFMEISFDYNTVQHVQLWGVNNGDTAGACSYHFYGCHFETTGATSGTSLPRLQIQAQATWSECELCESDGNNPTGYIGISDNSTVSAVNCRLNQSGTMALFVSSTSATKNVQAFGCQDQNLANASIMMLLDGNGVLMQPTPYGLGIQVFFGPPTPLALQYQNTTIDIENNSGSSQTITAPSNATANHAIGTAIKFVLNGSFTFVADTGVTLNIPTGQGPTSQGFGRTVYLIKYAANEWLLRGRDLGGPAVSLGNDFTALPTTATSGQAWNNSGVIELG